MSHNYHPHCGCADCDRVDEARESHEDTGPRVMLPDPIVEMNKWRPGFIRQRREFPWTVDGVRGLHPYQSIRTKAMRPVLGQLRMIEAAVGCTIACDAAVDAWRQQVAA